MKEVEKKDLPEISGGEGALDFEKTPMTPYFPPPVEFGPVVEMPENDPIQ